MRAVPIRERKRQEPKDIIRIRRLTALWLSDQCGLTYDQISMVLRVTPSLVHKMIKQARGNGRNVE